MRGAAVLLRRGKMTFFPRCPKVLADIMSPVGTGYADDLLMMMIWVYIVAKTGTAQMSL